MKTYYIFHSEYLQDAKEIEADDEIEAVNKYGEWYDEQNKYSLATKTIEISVADDKFSDVRSKFIIYGEYQLKTERNGTSW